MYYNTVLFINHKQTKPIIEFHSNCHAKKIPLSESDVLTVEDRNTAEYSFVSICMVSEALHDKGFVR